MKHLGQTRSALRPDHLLQTPDTFVRTPLPSISHGSAIVHISPAAGAGFTQYTVELQPGGVLAPAYLPGVQRFLYVVSGSVNLTSLSDPTTATLSQGGFAYTPPEVLDQVTAITTTVLQVVEKPITILTSNPDPEILLGNESDIPPVPLDGDPSLLVRSLLPTGPTYDFAVNTMTYAPGASLAQVEVHVMEHGLIMLEGEGIYRLSDRWYPVRGGDFIYMAPFCPQWFAAIGKLPAKYLIYKDFNRHPLA